MSEPTDEQRRMWWEKMRDAQEHLDDAAHALSGIPPQAFDGYAGRIRDSVSKARDDADTVAENMGEDE